MINRIQIFLKMRLNKNHSIDELKALFKDAQPKFVCLKNQNGQFVIHYNRPKENNQRWDEILKTLNKKSLTPGMYLVGFKSSTMPTGSEQEYPIQIGTNFINEPTPGMITFSQPSENVWTMSQALTIIAEKNKLELQLQFIELENKRLQRLIDELEIELNERQFLTENKTENPLGWVKDLKDTFAPIANLYFEQKDRELNLAEQKAGINYKSKKNESRTDGGIMPGENGYKEYFENILNSNNETALNYECDYLELNFPELYQKTMEYYKISEIPEPESKTDQNHE